MSERLYFIASTSFEAARHLPSTTGARGRLHGHSFVVRVRAALPAGFAPFDGVAAETLATRLQEVVAPLDYTLLNEQLAEPSDGNLAQWIYQHLGLSGRVQVWIQSALHQGALCDAHNQLQTWRRFQFAAAHRLPNVPPNHPCGRMHGHSFAVILRSANADAEQLASVWMPLQEQLQYSCLNELPGLENPTSECLATWLWLRLKAQLPHLSRVTVYETTTAGCHYDGQRYRIWKEQRFESALRFANAPSTDPRHRLHGHSYVLRLHLMAQLDAVMGWTVDYGAIKALFEPLYQQLDHQRLDELRGLPEPSLGALLYWIRQQIGDVLPSLYGIELEQTAECGALLCWGGRDDLQR